MKKTFLIVCGLTLCGLVNVANAQDQDTTTNYTNQRLEQAGDELDTASQELRQDVDDTEDALENAADSAEQDLDQAGDKVEGAWDGTKSEVKEEADQAGDEIREETHEAGEKVENAADDSGDKLEKIGKSGAAHLKDERLESKEGPHGETIFINEHGQYYYIDDKSGERVNVEKAELKDKE